MAFYPRQIYGALKEHLSNKQATVLTGMRRTGKTTLLKKLMEASDTRQKVFFDLERMDNRLLFSEKNYEVITYALAQRGIQLSDKVLIGLDEIQLVPNLPSVVKYLYDTYDIKFILTGSSSYYLKNQFSESLAGRKKIFEVYPLTFNELLGFKGVPFAPAEPFWEMPFLLSEYERLRHLYDEFIDFGGFPEVVLSEKTQDKKDLLADILSSYIRHDIAALQDFKKSTEAYKLIKLLAVRAGSRLEISKIATLTGMGRTTVENYLHLFEQSYLIRTIPVTSNSPDREIVKARKLYFLDNGIASMSGELGSGSKFENAVFNQLHHLGEVSYYSLKTGNEIDFVLDKKRAFEVKEQATEMHLKTARTLAQKIGISDAHVVGRHAAHRSFPGFVWGGFIQ
jgi:uncharacterized protein